MFETPKVANFTINGEEIVEYSLGWSKNGYTHMYDYNNGKHVMITVGKSVLTRVSVGFFNDINHELFGDYKYDTLTDEQKNKYLPSVERDVLVKDAMDRNVPLETVYKTESHGVNSCNML